METNQHQPFPYAFDPPPISEKDIFSIDSSFDQDFVSSDESSSSISSIPDNQLYQNIPFEGISYNGPNLTTPFNNNPLSMEPKINKPGPTYTPPLVDSSIPGQINPPIYYSSSDSSKPPVYNLAQQTINTPPLGDSGNNSSIPNVNSDSISVISKSSNLLSDRITSKESLNISEEIYQDTDEENSLKTQGEAINFCKNPAAKTNLEPIDIKKTIKNSLAPHIPMTDNFYKSIPPIPNPTDFHAESQSSPKHKIKVSNPQVNQESHSLIKQHPSPLVSNQQPNDEFDPLKNKRLNKTHNQSPTDRQEIEEEKTKLNISELNHGKYSMMFIENFYTFTIKKTLFKNLCCFRETNLYRLKQLKRCCFCQNEQKLIEFICENYEGLNRSQIEKHSVIDLFMVCSLIEIDDVKVLNFRNQYFLEHVKRVTDESIRTLDLDRKINDKDIPKIFFEKTREFLIFWIRQAEDNLNDSALKELRFLLRG